MERVRAKRKRMVECKDREDRLTRRLKWSKPEEGRAVDGNRLTVEISLGVNKSVSSQIVLICVSKTTHMTLRQTIHSH